MDNRNSNYRKLLWQIAKSVTNDDELTAHLKFRATHGTSMGGPDLIHTSLRSSRHIRLLTLWPGGIDEPIRCELNQVQIDSPDTIYTALSYTWGDPEQRLPIQCGDATVLVTIHLYSALLRLRQPDVGRVLWIDAVCIDQSLEPAAVAERAQQVRMMGTIYSSAEKVIVDLGGIKAEAMIRLLDIYGAWKWDPNRTTKWGEEGNNQESSRNTLSTATNRHLELLDYIVRRPWFGRVWVIQEFVLAQRIEFLIGSFTSGADMLTMILEILSNWIKNRTNTNSEISLMRPPRKRYDVTRLAWVIQFVTYLVEERRSRSLPGQRTLSISMLDTIASCQSTRKQDRIYGILGLLDPRYSSTITVDYLQSDSRLESMFAKILVENDFLPACLVHARGFNGDCASWSPSILNAPPDATGMTTNRISLWFEYYNACGAALSSCASVTAQNGVLVTSALRIDTIQAMSLPNRYDHRVFSKMMTPGWQQRTVDWGEQHLRWYRYVMNWVDQQFSDQESRDRHRTLWRTLTWDRFTDDAGKPSRYLQENGQIDAELESMAWDKVSRSLDGVSNSVSLEDLPPHCWNPAILLIKLFATGNMRLCRTENDRMALAPDKAVHGNEIWILPGVSIPVILRRMDQDQHIFVGFCYVHGIMDGQATSSPSLRLENVYIR